jgi:hypothetical protein
LLDGIASIFKPRRLKLPIKTGKRHDYRKTKVDMQKKSTDTHKISKGGYDSLTKERKKRYSEWETQSNQLETFFFEHTV